MVGTYNIRWWAYWNVPSFSIRSREKCVYAAIISEKSISDQKIKPFELVLVSTFLFLVLHKSTEHSIIWFFWLLCYLDMHLWVFFYWNNIFVILLICFEKVWHTMPWVAGWKEFILFFCMLKYLFCVSIVSKKLHKSEIFRQSLFGNSWQNRFWKCCFCYAPTTT